MIRVHDVVRIHTLYWQDDFCIRTEYVSYNGNVDLKAVPAPWNSATSIPHFTSMEKHNLMSVRTMRAYEWVLNEYYYRSYYNSACAITNRFHFHIYPGNPPDSMALASVTSLLHTSYCHFFSPSTPHSTRPVCMPTRMFRFTPVDSHTKLTNIEQYAKHTISISL